MSDSDKEKAVVEAITALMSALGPLDSEARAHVLEFVVKRLGIKLPGETMAAAPVPTGSNPVAAFPVDGAPDATPSTHPPKSTDIRTFAKAKNPKTVNERIAVIAFYLAHEAPPTERKDRITGDDIELYFVQAGFPLPTSSNMALNNTKNAGYLIAVDRGQYKLNAVGHNLVAHKLPAGDGSERNGSAARRGGKKAKPKRKT
jgi:hypothetical protein